MVARLDGIAVSGSFDRCSSCAIDHLRAVIGRSGYLCDVRNARRRARKGGKFGAGKIYPSVLRDRTVA